MVHKKSVLGILFGAALYTTMLTEKSYAYEGDIEGLGGDTHYYLAYDVFAVDSLKPYFNELIRYGGNSLYTYSNWANHANWEPDPQHSWGYFFNVNTLGNFNLNQNSTGWNFLRGGTTTHEFSFGALLHGLADSAVPCKHAPVEWEFDAGHDYWENQAVNIVPNYTAQPSPTEYLSGSFATKETALYALKTAYVAEFQNFWNGTPPYRSLTELQYEAAKTMQIAADAILKQYFDGQEILTPDYILIDWTFDEGDSSVYGSDHQYIYNHHGSLNANLVRGWTHGSDRYDGTWDTGYNRSGAWRGTLLSENNGGQTCCKSFNWTGHEARTLTKVGVDDKSFAMEFIVSPDSLPTSSAEDDTNPPTLMNFYDANGGPGYWHLTGFYKNVDMHDCVRFDYQDSSNGYDSLTIDLTSQGFTITPGKWYYVAIDYNYDVATATGTLRLVVRDMATGGYKTASKAALPAKHFYGSSTPLMLIGGDSNDYDFRPFDGRIDRIRYHNKAIANSRRLYWTSTLAYWKFNENTGQLVENTSGSSTIDLRFGSSTSSDTSDPTWTTGLYGSAMFGRKYTVANVPVYARDNGWTLKDKESMTPGNSYAIETIINLGSFPASGEWNNVNLMGIVKYWDSASSGKTQYLLRIYTASDLRPKVRFYAQHADGTSTDFTIDPQDAGLTLNTGQWYYMGAIYTDEGTGSGILKLIVVDMSTGFKVFATTPSKPLAGLTDKPTTTFLIGSEYTTSSGRCFDGKIDEVRISNKALPESDRLYGPVLPPEPALEPEVTTVLVHSYSSCLDVCPPANCINGAGLGVHGANTHSNALADGCHWYDEYTNNPWVVLDLGGAGILKQMKIWNANFFNSPDANWRHAQVQVSLTNPAFDNPSQYQDLGTIEIPPAPMTDTESFGKVFPISHTGIIRYVKLRLNSKWDGGIRQAGLSEIKFYGTVEPIPVPLTLIGYWPLDGNAEDASGNGNHGTTLGGISWVDGQHGQCAQFNGTDTGIDIANPENFDFTDEISLSFWVNQDAVQSSYAMVINKMSCSFASLDGWMIFTGQDGWTSTGMNNWFKSTIDSYGVRTTPTCVDGWHHVAVTVKGTVLKVYFDGFLHEGWGYDLPGPMKGAAGYPLAFGHKSNPAGDLGSFWKGKLDEVRFYHGTLSLEDVKALYQQGGGILCAIEPIAEDINKDCRVDLADLVQMAEKWFECYTYNNYGCN